jgi:hypothetical protein
VWRLSSICTGTAEAFDCSTSAELFSHQDVVKAGGSRLDYTPSTSRRPLRAQAGNSVLFVAGH